MIFNQGRQVIRLIIFQVMKTLRLEILANCSDLEKRRAQVSIQDEQVLRQVFLGSIQLFGSDKLSPGRVTLADSVLCKVRDLYDNVEKFKLSLPLREGSKGGHAIDEMGNTLVNM